jgi:hypothetical protein
MRYTHHEYKSIIIYQPLWSNCHKKYVPIFPKLNFHIVDYRSPAGSGTWQDPSWEEQGARRVIERPAGSHRGSVTRNRGIIRLNYYY